MVTVESVDIRGVSIYLCKRNRRSCSMLGPSDANGKIIRSRGPSLLGQIGTTGVAFVKFTGIYLYNLYRCKLHYSSCV